MSQLKKHTLIFRHSLNN